MKRRQKNNLLFFISFLFNSLSPTGSFWLNLPLPRDAEGNWYGGLVEERSVELDVDPL